MVLRGNWRPLILSATSVHFCAGNSSTSCCLTTSTVWQQQSRPNSCIELYKDMSPASLSRAYCAQRSNTSVLACSPFPTHQPSLHSLTGTNVLRHADFNPIQYPICAGYTKNSLIRIRTARMQILPKSLMPHSVHILPCGAEPAERIQMPACRLFARDSAGVAHRFGPIPASISHMQHVASAHVTRML